MIQLYEDQEEVVQLLRESMRGGRKSILCVASPAFGKTVLAGYITQQVMRRAGASVWFLVHRKNLLRQTSKSFAKSRIEHGLLTSGRVQTTQSIQVGTIGTVYSRLQKLKAPTILFVDEAHLSRGNMFESVITWALKNGSTVIGLTGTPKRLDGKSLGDIFDDMVEAKPTKWLIDQGRLSDYDLWSSPPLTGIRVRGGEYDKTESAGAMSTRQIFGDVVSQWRKHANGMRSVAYCVDRKHAQKTCDYFNSCGISAVYVDGESTESEIKDACEGLASGKYNILCNCELVIEGFDLSAQVGYDCTIECVILLRPTKSLARYLQMVFRALRAKPYKAVILDHAGCVHDHGMPCRVQEWSLYEEQQQGASRSASKDEIKARQCPECWFTFAVGPDCCPACGEVVQLTQRELEVIEGEMVKIEKEQQQAERKRDQGRAREIDELVALGIRRGMKKPAQWAAITFAGRHKRKPTTDEFKRASDALLRLTE